VHIENHLLIYKQLVPQSSDSFTHFSHHRVALLTKNFFKIFLSSAGGSGPVKS